jgi:flagellar protein FliO/FliZ
MTDSALTPLLSFALVIVLIPVALWLLKRTPMGGAAQGHGMKTIGALPLSASQRVVTVEVGHGAERRWLVLGVTPQSITTLHTMTPREEPHAP